MNIKKKLFCFLNFLFLLDFINLKCYNGNRQVEGLGC